jgi:outer membrane lipoprotein carrier protein
MIPLLSAIPGSAEPRSPALDKLLKAVQDRYNHMPSLKLDFSETYAGMRRPVTNGAGVLYLRKPGRMRWEYSSPRGKLFLSDGKEVILYSPDDNRAEKSKLKESEDVRAPIAVLLGKLDFAKEFKSFETRTEPGGTWIVATPKSDSLIYTKVEFLATPDGEIHRVRITGQDQSKLDFTFSNERDSVPVPDSLFKFEAPPGVQIVEAER